MSDAAASDLPLVKQLPSTKPSSENDSRFPKELPLEVIHMIITDLAMLGGSNAVTAMLLSKELAPKFSKLVFEGSQVHWMNLDNFMAALRREHIQELEHLTIDLRQESDDLDVKNTREGFSCIPYVPHPERVFRDLRKDRKRYDCDGPSTALSRCNFKVQNLRIIEFYTRMDCNRGLDWVFASSVKTLTCLDYGYKTTQDGHKSWSDVFDYVKDSYYDRMRPFNFPNCRFLWLESSEKDLEEGLLRPNADQPIVNFPNLDYVYVIIDVDDKQSLYAVYTIAQFTSFKSSAEHNPKIALVIQHHTESPPFEELENAKNYYERSVEKEYKEYSSRTGDHQRRFFHRMACTLMHCPKGETLNTESGRARIQEALNPIWKAKEKMRKHYPDAESYDYRSCYPNFKGECAMKRKRDEAGSDWSEASD